MRWDLILAAAAALSAAAGATSAAAQPASREAIYEQYLHIDRLIDNLDLQPRWSAAGDRLFYTTVEAGLRTWWALDVAGGARRPLFDTGRLATALSKAGVVGAVESVAPGGGDRLRMRVGEKLVDFDPATYEVQAAAAAAPGTFRRQMTLFMSERAPDVPSPDGRETATLKDGEIWLYRADGTRRQLTTGAVDRYGWDLETQAPIPHPVPTPWSPDGRTLYAARLDRRHATRLPVLKTTGIQPVVETVDVLKSDGPVYGVEPAFIDIATGRVTPIKVEASGDVYLAVLGWSLHGDQFLMARANRDFTRVEVLSVDGRTGESRLVLRETGPTFVRIQHRFIYGADVGFDRLPDGSGFVWQSERDGVNQLYLYGFDGKLRRKLTPDAVPVLAVKAIDPKGWVYYTAHGDPERPYDEHLYRVPLKGGRAQRVTSGEGEHRVTLAPGLQAFVDVHSTPGTAPVTEVRRTDGALVRELAMADLRRLKALGWTPPEEFKVKAADGKTDLWGVLYKPSDFDASKAYPLIEDIYGGPQTASAPHHFVAEASKGANFPQALAQQGFLVLQLDSRGTPGRSKAFHDFVSDNWGKGVVAEHATAIRNLAATRSYVDLARVGIYGHSWGGYNAFMALATQGDVYRAAISSGPDYNLDSPNILEEPYLGLPSEHPGRYVRATPYQYVGAIKPDTLMLMSGTIDVNFYPDILRMSDLLQKRGVRHEFVPMPDQGHGYSPAGYDYQFNVTGQFFARTLK